MTENRPFALESKTSSKERLLKKIQDLRKNKRYTIQTRKNVGGGPVKYLKKKGRAIKKAFTPSTPSTKSVFNPRRYLAYESTKKKRALQATAKSGIQFAVKHEHYSKGIDLINKYKDEKAKAKLLPPDAKKKKLAEIAALKKELKKIGVNSGNIEKALTQFTQKRDSYERKKQKSTVTSDTLKAESVNFIKGRTDYITKGQPELKNKLGALVSTDHTKMAMIKLPGVGNTPVSKLKYADFTDPKVTEAYLNQFKTVNASISKINKNFNINHLSENGKIELAKELHKITKDGIVDPVKQEEHFLKAVTDITYKDKVYSALDSSSKSAAKSYIAANPVKVYEDTPEPTMRQRHDEITKKLQNPDLTAEEKKHFEDELKYLNTELVVEPNDIQKQIDEARRRMTGETDYKQKNKIQEEITRLEARKAEIEKRNADDNIEANEAIKKEIATLEKVTKMPSGYDEGIRTEDIKDNLSAIDKQIAKVNDEITKLGETGETKTDVAEAEIFKKQDILTKLNKEKQQLSRKLENYQNYEKNQALIGQLTSMTPENRAKFAEDLRVKDGNELKDILSAEQQKVEQFSNNPTIQRILQRNVDNIQKTINTKNLLQSVANNKELKPTQKDYIQTQITSAMTANDVAELKGNVIADKNLNYLLQKQQLTRLREEAKREKGEAKGRLSAARAEVQTKGFLTRFGRKFVSAPSVKKAKRDIKEQRAQSAFLGKAEKAWKPGTESYTRGKYRPFTKTRKVSANTLERKLLLSQYPKKLDIELNTFKKTATPNEIKYAPQIFYTSKYDELKANHDAEIKAIEQKGDMTPKEKAKQIADAKETYDGKLEALENWHKQFKPLEKKLPSRQKAIRYKERKTIAVANPITSPFQEQTLGFEPRTITIKEYGQQDPLKTGETVVPKPSKQTTGAPIVTTRVNKDALRYAQSQLRQMRREKREREKVKEDRKEEPQAIKNLSAKNIETTNQPIKEGNQVVDEQQIAKKATRGWRILKESKSKKSPLQTPEMVKRQQEVLDVWTNALRESKGNPVILKKTTPNVLKLLGTNPNTKELTNMIKTATALQITKANIEKRLNLLTKSAGKSPQPQYIAGLQKQLEEIKVKEQAIDTKIQDVQQQFSVIASQAPVEQQQLTTKQQAQEAKKQKQLQKIQGTVEQLKFNKKLKDMINTPLPEAKDLKAEFNTFNPQQPNFTGISNPKINQFEKIKLDELQAANKAAENMINSSNLPPNKKEELKRLVNQKNLLKAAEIRDWAEKERQQ